MERQVVTDPMTRENQGMGGGVEAPRSIRRGGRGENLDKKLDYHFLGKEEARQVKQVYGGLA